MLDNRLRKGWNTLVKNHDKPTGKSNAERGGALEVKAAHSAAQWRRAKTALGREHGLGAGRAAGDRLCQLVREDGKLVAVLVWCAAAWHLQARDETVGWDAVTRSRRLKLVVQLRRFLVLEATRRPNLASQCLGAGLRELTGQWEAQHGYRPLLAESFSDPESHAGTVYKATNWTQAGLTKGYARCGMIVTLCRHEDGRPVAMTVARGQKEDCEVSGGRALLADPQVQLVQALVTADPLHNKEETVRVILDKGGDYLLGTKENTRKRLAGATQALQGTPFLT